MIFTCHAKPISVALNDIKISIIHLLCIFYDVCSEKMTGK